jgi:putative tricarboxylic transport membrane protein
MKKTGFEPGPLVLAFVLGPILERAFRQSMLLSGGSFDIFVTRPISGTMFALMGLLIVYSAVSSRRRRSRLPGVVEAELADADAVAEPEGSTGLESVGRTTGTDIPLRGTADDQRPPTSGER